MSNESSTISHNYKTRSRTISNTPSTAKQIHRHTNKKPNKKVKRRPSKKYTNDDDDDDDADDDDDSRTDFDVDEYGNIKDLIDYGPTRSYRKKKRSPHKNKDRFQSEDPNSDQLMDKLKLITSLVKRVEHLKQSGHSSSKRHRFYDRDESDEYLSETLSEYSSDEELCSDSELNELLKQQFSKQNKWKKQLTKEEKRYYKTLSTKQKQKYENDQIDIVNFNVNQIPIKFKILNMSISTQSKSYLMTRLQTFQGMDESDNEYHKLKNWFNNFNKIPVNKYVKFPISTTSATPEKVCEFLTDSRNVLDTAVYGHDSVKNEIIQIISQWITNPNSKGNVLALQGPMGNGKTTLAKNGLAKVLKRPFALIALGGAKDSAFLNGHEYTFEGSKCGRIVEVLRDLQCMNPIIFFDELDKISDTATGQEISNLLCHITDPVQNSEFQDRYFSGIDLDLSKAIFVMSFNDESKINSILKDRMHVVRMKGFGANDKVKIARQYLIPSICEELQFDSDNVLLSDEIIKHIIADFTSEEGVRSLRRKLKMIYSKLNVVHLVNKSTETDIKDIVSFKLDNMNFPLELTHSRIQSLLSNNDNDLDTSYKMLYM